MRRPDGFSALPHRCGYHSPRRPGYTLVEILTATVLMIIIMLAVTVIFASVTESIGQSRATLEMTQRLRSASALLKQDLENVTVAMTPPAHPRDNSGYFEYVEGPIGPVVPPENVAWNIDNNAADSTVGDIDDILMFTAKTEGEPYVGRMRFKRSLLSGETRDGADSVGDFKWQDTVVSSNCAEILYFMRGRTLYRRILLVKPDVDFDQRLQGIQGPAYFDGFYAHNDISVHKDWRLDGTPYLAASSLADLTKPECRFGHHPDPRIWTPARWTNPASSIVRFQHERRPHPFFYRPWLGFPLGTPSDPVYWIPGLGLPILAECSAGNWQAGGPLPINTPPSPVNPALAADVVETGRFDAWANPHPWNDKVNALTGAMTNYAGARIGEDVVLTNVIAFDVKAWDPYAPILDSPAGVPLLPGDPGYITRIRDGVGPANVLGTGAYVDLNYLAPLGGPAGAVLPNLTGLPFGYTPFCGAGDLQSRVYGTLPQYAASRIQSEFYPAVYDTWSLHYEFNRRWMRFSPGGTLEEVGDEDGDGIFDRGSNGIDDDGLNGVDDVGERETQPPYAVPLQGIQVRIRTFEPGSRQIREVTLVQKFRTR